MRSFAFALSLAGLAHALPQAASCVTTTSEVIVPTSTATYTTNPVSTIHATTAQDLGTFTLRTTISSTTTVETVTSTSTICTPSSVGTASTVYTTSGQSLSTVEAIAASPVSSSSAQSSPVTLSTSSSAGQSTPALISYSTATSTSHSTSSSTSTTKTKKSKTTSTKTKQTKTKTKTARDLAARQASACTVTSTFTTTYGGTYTFVAGTSTSTYTQYTAFSQATTTTTISGGKAYAVASASTTISAACGAGATVTQDARCSPAAMTSAYNGFGLQYLSDVVAGGAAYKTTASDASSCCQLCAEAVSCAGSAWDIRTNECRLEFSVDYSSGALNCGQSLLAYYDAGPNSPMDPGTGWYIANVCGQAYYGSAKPDDGT